MKIQIDGNDVQLIQEGTEEVLFKGTKKELEQLLLDVKQIAEFIKVDIDADLLIDDSDGGIAFETYQDFANKYDK